MVFQVGAVARPCPRLVCPRLVCPHVAQTLSKQEPHP